MTRKKLYEGKAKIIYEGTDPGTLIQYFKDEATAFNNKKKGIISGKGVINNRISEYIMTRLEEIGVQTHFIKTLNMREQLVKAADMIPVEVVVRNITAGSLCQRLGVEEGMLLPSPIIEFYLKSDELGDPMLGESHIISFGWADMLELEEMKALALRVNDFLSGLFLGVGIKLVDFKLEIGRIFDEEGNVYLIIADEITPDSCRLWDIHTGEKMDKDRFRHDLGKVEEAYQEVARRLGVLIENNNESNNVMEFCPTPTLVKKKSLSKKPIKNKGKGKKKKDE